MNNISVEELNQFVNTNIDKFHQSKAKSLQQLGLKMILARKNPYLFKAKNLHTASDLIKDIMDAFLSSSEEKLFGDFLEELAIFISSKTCNGQKSAATGIDLEFTNKGINYLVSIKSGTSWGNSTQQKKQEENFQTAVRVKKQLDRTMNVQPVLGICYGKTKTSFLRGYMKVVGQSFWHLISDNPNFYTDIIEPLGYRAKEHNEAFLAEKGRIINIFTQEFINDFCDDGEINWKKLVEFNSGNLDTPEVEKVDEEIKNPIKSD
ncbi:MAG TPA: PmeII family type II restriction endonuclease [Methylomirabilota bacterium]|nr:PmeII family type II restriction endonuclease [Methylomirabilota bacterium]